MGGRSGKLVLPTEPKKPQDNEVPATVEVTSGDTNEPQHNGGVNTDVPLIDAENSPSKSEVNAASDLDAADTSNQLVKVNTEMVDEATNAEADAHVADSENKTPKKSNSILVWVRRKFSWKRSRVTNPGTPTSVATDSRPKDSATAPAVTDNINETAEAIVQEVVVAAISSEAGPTHPEPQSQVTTEVTHQTTESTSPAEPAVPHSVEDVKQQEHSVLSVEPIVNNGDLLLESVDKTEQVLCNKHLEETVTLKMANLELSNGHAPEHFTLESDAIVDGVVGGISNGTTHEITA